ncbi:hypothetical protein HZB90_04365, partial [archaeon]|nr:hypothetical protein [archaeon]
DMVNASSAQIDSSKEDATLFGSRVVMENSGVINVTDMLSGNSYILSGENMSIYGGLLAYANSSGEVVVADLLSPNLYNFSLGTGDNPVIYDKIVVFERGDDLYYARRNITLPATFIFEDDPVSASLAYLIDTTLTPDNETYFWRIKGCDNSFANNSCVWGLTDFVPGPGVTNFTLFNIDNTAPSISSVSPSQGSVVAGLFRVFADITDVNDVPYVNYTILYRNNRTLRNASTMTVESGTAWHSSTLDFRDINVSDFTLTIWAKDEKDNWNSAEVNFTVNNNTAWFLFGTGDDEIVNGKVLDTVINADFIAFNVFTSTIRIVGPLPATTVRSIQSKTNLTITNHNYSDPISTLTWPDGSYRAEFTGNTFDGTKTANRMFYVDKNAPVNSSNSTSPSPLYAADMLSIGINWTDITLTEVKFTYNNTNRSNYTQMNWSRKGNYLDSGYRNLTGPDRIDVSAYINRSFGWNASARDGRNRSSSYVYSVFVNDNPPRTIAVMPDVNVTEDTLKPFSSFLISTYFDDPNTIGTWGYLDNLTYAFDSNCSAVSFAYNATGGRVFNVTSTSNFTGYCNVRVNATDFYNKRNSSNFTLYVSPVNDYPTIDPIPDIYTTEDNASGVNYTLVKWDVDGDATTWLVEPGYDHSIFNMTWNNTALSMFNFTLMPDAFGDYNITFRVSDGNLTTERNATVHITGENDAPVIGTITYPGIGNITRNTFTITWTNATDKANEHQVLNYSLEYSINGGASWNIPSGCSALYQNLSCSWNSLTDIVGTENVTLRLNVTDGLADDPLIYGNFTVDNQGPVITINKPTTVMVGSSFVTDINTTEPASCTFALNGSAQSSTYLTTLHNITVSGYAYNTTYNLSMTCTDNVGNSVSAYRLFEPRAACLEYIGLSVTPEILYQNAAANVTLMMATNGTVASGSTWTLHFPDGTNTGLVLFGSTFSPAIDASNKAAYNITTQTSQAGQYNITLNSFTSSGCGVAVGPISIVEAFHVYEAVNQTLNVN